MKEDFLHFLWKQKLFATQNLLTTNGELLTIKNSGFHNYNSGPDFLNATIFIDQLLWAGNVEIHINSSDWYVHHHEKDASYDTVILHVVWKDDVAVFDANNQQIPTLELHSLVNESLLKKYYDLFSKESRWIPCEKLIGSVDSFLIKNCLERLYFERLEKRSIEINNLLTSTKNDYETVLFILLAKNFGLKSNGEAFLSLATSFDFSVLRKVRSNELQLHALLFGQAGFLSEEFEDSYYSQLQNEYEYLKLKYHLNPISKEVFQFFRMRPTNFPTIRIAQLASLYAKCQNVFSKLINFTKLEAYYQYFSMDLPEFWDTHYTFEKRAKKHQKRFTKPFIDLLLINTIIPLKFTYSKNRGEINEQVFLKLLAQIKPEKNSIITKFNDLKITSTSALETQALLTLKNNYCASKRCLQCAIGSKLLKN